MTEANRVLTENDSGKEISLSPGERFAVALGGNPTSGYRWETSAINDALIRPVGEPGFVLSSPSVGSGGLFKFTFEASAPGHTTLRLVYRRPFEKKAKPLRVFSIEIVISAS